LHVWARTIHKIAKTTQNPRNPSQNIYKDF